MSPCLCVTGTNLILLFICTSNVGTVDISDSMSLCMSGCVSLCRSGCVSLCMSGYLVVCLCGCGLSPYPFVNHVPVHPFMCASHIIIMQMKSPYCHVNEENSNGPMGFFSR